MGNISYLERAKKFIENNPELFKKPEVVIQPQLLNKNGSESDISSRIEPCRTCNGTRFWRSKSGGHLVCPKCHPPISEGEVIEWIEAEEEK